MAARIIVGDALQVLNELEPESVQSIVTSPPYWWLRDYGVPGQLGLEGTPREYVMAMLRVFRAARKVLRRDGTLWLNLGDSYSTQAGQGKVPGGGGQGQRWERINQTADPKSAGGREPMWQPNRRRIAGLKPKDLVGIPWRVAFALQRHGWWLRSDIIWSKPNPMPESVRDRPTRCHEYLFLMSRSRRYYYDAAAIAEPIADGTAARLERAHGDYQAPGQPAQNGTAGPRPNRRHLSPIGAAAAPQIEDDSEAFNATRNARTVWEIATTGYAEAHFATFPPELPRRSILAGTRRGDRVLDPFAGAGTVGLVADRLGRDFLGIELNPEYARLAERRIREDAPLFADVTVTASKPERTE